MSKSDKRRDIDIDTICEKKNEESDNLMRTSIERRLNTDVIINLLWFAIHAIFVLRPTNDEPWIYFKSHPIQSDSFGWPLPSCLFPDWLAGVTWRDLDNKHLLRLDHKNDTIFEFLNRKRKESLLSESKCVGVMGGEGESGIILKVFTTQVWCVHACLYSIHDSLYSIHDFMSFSLFIKF